MTDKHVSGLLELSHRKAIEVGALMMKAKAAEDGSAERTRAIGEAERSATVALQAIILLRALHQ